METVKNKKRAWRFLVVAALVLSGVIGGALGLQSDQPALVEAAGATYPVTVNSAAIAADTTWSGRVWNWDGSDRVTAEVWYNIDQGTINTTTIYLDVSPDNSMWKTGEATVVSANAADATGYATTTIVGRYYRIRADTTNTNTITPTIKVILK